MKVSVRVQAMLLVSASVTAVACALIYVQVFQAHIRSLVPSLAMLLLAVPLASYLIDRILVRSLERERRAEQRFRSLVQSSTDSITIMDRDGTVRYQSPAIEPILGYRPEELVGTRPLHLIHPDDLDRVLELYKDTDGSDFGKPIECRWGHRDGSWRVVQTTRTNLLDDPSVAGIVVNTRDITEQKALEEQLRQSQKMDAVGRLAGGVAHDFNNLLAVIQNYASFVAEDLDEASPLRDDVEEIKRAATRAAGLTRQLLTFSRREFVSPEVLDVNEVVWELKKLLSRAIPESIEFSVELDPEVWPCKVDRSQLEQVLMNLAVNAKDAMPEGGKIFIGTYNLSVESGADAEARGLAPGRYTAISVVDTGTGMDDEVLGRAFEPFFTTKPKGEGTGLGLATIYGIAEQAGGHVTVDSRAGIGTTFTVFFPASSEPLSGPLTAGDGNATAVRGEGESVLVTEDEEAVRALVGRILEGNGYEVVAASNGAEALELHASLERPVSLLVTDVIMPGISGRELAAKILERQPELPVVYMSGYDDQAVDRSALEEGHRYLAKPFTAAQLLQIVNKTLVEVKSKASVSP